MTHLIQGRADAGQVHVEDVASLIVASMKHNLEGPPPAGYSRFYLYVTPYS